MNSGVPGSGTDRPGAEGTAPQGRLRRGGNLALGAVCALALLAMTLLTVSDVVGRYLLQSPIRGASEVTELLLVVAVYTGLIAVCLDRAHVTVDLLVHRIPRRLQPVQQLFIGLVSGGVLAMISWRLWVYGQQIASYGGTTSSLKIPLAPAVYFTAACAAVAAVITLGAVWRVFANRER